MAIAVSHKVLRGYPEARYRNRWPELRRPGPPLSPEGANRAQLASFICATQPSALGKEKNIHKLLTKLSSLLPGNKEDKEVREEMLERIADIASMYPNPDKVLEDFLATYKMLAQSGRRKDGRISSNIRELQFFIRLRGLARLWELAALQHDGASSSFQLPFPCNYADLHSLQYIAARNPPLLKKRMHAADLVLHGDSYIDDLVHFAYKTNRSARVKADFAFSLSSIDGYLAEMGKGEGERIDMLRPIVDMCKVYRYPYDMAVKFESTYSFIVDIVSEAKAGHRKFKVGDGKGAMLKEFLETVESFLSVEGLENMRAQAESAGAPIATVPFLSASDLEVLKTGYGTRRVVSVFDINML